MIAVTGSASGIGAALRARLEAEGARVVGVDVREAEVCADLGTPRGRADAVAAVVRLAGGRLDGVVACAGLGPHVGDHTLLVRVNYFGAVALLDGLRPALAAARGAAVAVSSNSAMLPAIDAAVEAACVAGDEAAAAAAAEAGSGPMVYAGAKRALARWVRTQATTPAWAGAGVRLNAVAPGATRTPLLDGGLADATLGPAIRAFPIPLGTMGEATQVAGAIAFLLGRDASFCCGSVLVVDGGTDALFRPDVV